MSSKKTQVRFSAADDEQLIEIVSGYPILWDMKLQKFKNVAKKDTIWNEMDKMLQKADGQCKARWKSIRDHYKRQKKLEKNSPTGSAATKKRALYWDRLRFLDSVEDERESQSNFQSSQDDLIDRDQGASHNSGRSAAGNEEIVIETNDSTEESVNENQLNRKREMSVSRTPDKVSTSVGPPTKKNKTNDTLLQLMKNKEQERQHLGKYINQIMESNEDEIDLFFRSLAGTVKKFQPEDVTEAKMKIFNVVTEIEIRNQRARRNNMTTFNESNSRSNSAFTISTVRDNTRPNSAFSSHSSQISLGQSSMSNMSMTSPPANMNLSENVPYEDPSPLQDENTSSITDFYERSGQSIYENL